MDPNKQYFNFNGVLYTMEDIKEEPDPLKMVKQERQELEPHGPIQVDSGSPPPLVHIQKGTRNPIIGRMLTRLSLPSDLETSPSHLNNVKSVSSIPVNKESSNPSTLNQKQPNNPKKKTSVPEHGQSCLQIHQEIVNISSHTSCLTNQVTALQNMFYHLKDQLNKSNDMKGKLLGEVKEMGLKLNFLCKDKVSMDYTDSSSPLPLKSLEEFEKVNNAIQKSELYRENFRDTIKSLYMTGTHRNMEDFLSFIIGQIMTAHLVQLLMRTYSESRMMYMKHTVVYQVLYDVSKLFYPNTTKSEFHTSFCRFFEQRIDHGRSKTNDDSPTKALDKEELENSCIIDFTSQTVNIQTIDDTSISNDDASKITVCDSNYTSQAELEVSKDAMDTNSKKLPDDTLTETKKNADVSKSKNSVTIFKNITPRTTLVPDRFSLNSQSKDSCSVPAQCGNSKRKRHDQMNMSQNTVTSSKKKKNSQEIRTSQLIGTGNVTPKMSKIRIYTGKEKSDRTEDGSVDNSNVEERMNETSNELDILDYEKLNETIIEDIESVCVKEKAPRTKDDIRFELYKSLPMKSEEAFHKFNDLIRTDKELEETFIETLKGMYSIPRPNKSCTMFVRAKIKSIMSDQISGRCLMSSGPSCPGTICFGDTPIYQALLNVIKTLYPGINVTTVKLFMVEYFRIAKSKNHGGSPKDKSAKTVSYSSDSDYILPD
uniref:DUF4806 domain-containing protein n=1 Tax=Cacopsylla melanoneura TaxID=428564 RepID=A0A8D8LTY2_9HEMI